MDFNLTTIAPKGRYKYGQYFSSGNITKKVVSTTYGGDASNNDLGGGGGGDKPKEEETFVLDLSQSSINFDGAQVAYTAVTQSVDLVGYKGKTRMDTFVGDVSGTHTYNPNTDTYTPALPANYGITGVPQTGMVVVVEDNGTPDTRIHITLDNTLPAGMTYGTLQIPCNLYLKSADGNPLGDNIVDWEDAERLENADGVDVGTDYVANMVLSLDWSVTTNAQSAYRLDLTNDAGSINCDDQGNVLTGATRPVCEAMLYLGLDQVTSVNFTISYNNSQNVTGLSIHTTNDGVGHIDYDTPSGTYFNFDGDHLDVTITAYISSTPIASKVFTITKSLPHEGEAATSYWLTFSANKFKYDPNTQTMTPTAITASVMMQVGQDTPTAATGCSIWYGYDTEYPTTQYTTGITPQVSSEYVAVVARKGNQSGPIVDGVEMIPILVEGKNGTNGVSAYRLDLTNENASINCDSSGNILTGAVRPTCTAKLYLGTTAVTGAAYSIATASCSYSGVSINSSTGVITFNPGTASTPFWFDTAYTSIELTVEAKISNISYGTTIMTISRAMAGRDGASGRSITGVTEYYAINNNSSTAPTSWSTAMTQPTSASPYLWNYESIAYDSGSPTNTTPVIIAYYTKDGKGISAITEYYLINNSSASTPSTALTSWTTTLQVPTESNPYLWNYEKITYTDGTSDSTTPVIIGVKGTNGTDAVSYWLVLDADEIKLTTANTFTPATITATAYKQIGENTPTVASDATIKWDYDTVSPTRTYSSTITVTGTSHNYITFQLYAGGVVRDTETVLILRDGKDGASTPGRQGPAIRGPYDWYYEVDHNPGRKWCNGSGATNTEESMFIDVILKDGVYYYCNTSYTEAGASWANVSSKWTSAETAFDFVAAHLILADEAKINFLTDNEIYLMDSSNTVTAGAAGGDGLSFWAGGDKSSDPPFQVWSDGSIKATSGTFSGYIQMPYTFVAGLRKDAYLSASTVGTICLSQTNYRGIYQYPNTPSNPVSGDSFLSLDSNMNGTYKYYNTAWRTMTHYSVGGSYYRGYIADEHAYLISDGQTGNYGMGDGGTLVLPKPTSALNGFVYDIIVQANYATKASSQNFGLKVICSNYGAANDDTYRFRPYCFSTGYIDGPDEVGLYGGRARFVCIPEYVDNNTTKYVWAITDATGGFDLINNVVPYAGFSPVHGYADYSVSGNYNGPLYRIQADSNLPADNQKKSDTLYVTRS